MKIDAAAQEKIDELRAERDYYIDLSIAVQEENWELQEQLKAAKAQIAFLQNGQRVDLKVV